MMKPIQSKDVPHSLFPEKQIGVIGIHILTAFCDVVLSECMVST
jgi:hypothetical protein